MGKHELSEDTGTVLHTADAVVVAYVGSVDYVLLVRRKYAPYAGMWALPGGHQDPGEMPLWTARRELAEETGLRLAPGAFSRIGVYDEPGRDPRGRYSTTAFVAELDHLPDVVAADDADSAAWVPQASLAGLAFDHAVILGDAYAVLAG